MRREDVCGFDANASPQAQHPVMRRYSRFRIAIAAWQPYLTRLTARRFGELTHVMFPLFRPLLSDRHASTTIVSVPRLLRMASLAFSAVKYASMASV